MSALPTWLEPAPGDTLTRVNKTEIHVSRAKRLRQVGVELSWLESQQMVAERCAEIAVLLLARIESEADDGRGRDIAGCAQAIGILIDKAQLLTGAATSRSETITSPDEAVARLQELYGRLEQRASSIPAAAADAG